MKYWKNLHFFLTGGKSSHFFFADRGWNSDPPHMHIGTHTSYLRGRAVELTGDIQIQIFWLLLKANLSHTWWWAPWEFFWVIEWHYRSSMIFLEYFSFLDETLVHIPGLHNNPHFDSNVCQRNEEKFRISFHSLSRLYLMFPKCAWST